MNRKIIISISVLLTSMLACVVPPGMTPTPVFFTQVVVVPNAQVLASPTLPVPALPAETITPLPTLTPVSTATPLATATISGPSITLIKNGNCRNGPGTINNVVTSYLKGDTLKIVGRNPDFDNTWWQVEMPTGGKCWLSLATGQAVGPFDDIPIIP